MTRSALRWLSFLLAILVIGPLAGRLLSIVHGVDGSLHASPLVSQSPALGLAIALLIVVITSLYALGVASRLGIAAGMNSAGAIFGWCAFDSGQIDAILRAAPQQSTLLSLSLESGLLGAGSLVLVFLLGRTCSDAASLRHAGPVASRVHAGAALAAMLFAGVCVNLIAFQPLKGQAVFAALIASIAAGAVAQLGAAGAGQFVPMLVPFASIAMLATLAPLAALRWHGSNIFEASPRGALIGICVPHGFDWLCGAFLGVPVGVAWAESMMEHRTPPITGSPPAN